MINRNEFTKIAKKILGSNKQLRTPEIMHPNREWSLGLFVAIMIFCGTAFWSAQTYKAYQNTSVDLSDKNEESAVYRELLVKAALEKFNLRKQEHDLLMGAPSVEVEAEPAINTENAASSTESEVITNEEPTAEAEASVVGEAGATSTPEQPVLPEGDVIEVSSTSAAF